MRNHLLALASLVVLSMPAQAAVVDAEQAVAAMKTTVPELRRQLASLPVEFGLVSALLPYGGESLPQVQNPAKADALAVIEAKEEYWKGVLSSLVSAYAAKSLLQLDGKADGPVAMGKDFDRHLAKALLDVMELRLLEKKINAVKLVVSDIAEDRALVERMGKVSSAEISERLTRKQEALKKIEAALAA